MKMKLYAKTLLLSGTVLLSFLLTAILEATTTELPNTFYAVIGMTTLICTIWIFIISLNQILYDLSV